MRIVRIACYSFLPALLLILASGRLLKVDRSPVSILLGAGLVLFSAAVSVLVHRRQSSSYRKLLLYLACAGLITAVQITGGYGSVLYFIYLIFLLWVALPSVGGLATEMGLIIGLTGSLALLNSALWTGEDSFIARLVPLLLPALRQLMIPFLFGLAADWLAEREFVMPAHAGPEKEKETSSRLFAPEAYGILVRLLHRGSGAETTCCFQRSDDGFFRLSEHAAAGSSVISRFMLPPGHRLARIAQNSREPVYIRADSGKERAELAPYRMPGEGEVSLWIIVSPVWRKNELKGFLLQDFRGDRPSSAAGETLQRVSSVMGERRGGPGGWKGTGNSFMPILVAACGSDGMDRSVQDMTAILADMITGATVSVAEVESADRTTRIWVSRGPLAGRRRGRKYDSSSGIAGWIVKNRVPCRRSGLKRGERRVGVFSDGSDPYSSGSVIGTPVMRDREVMALIIAEHPDDEAFSRDHEEILAAAAGLLSLREELDRLRQRFCSIEGRDTLTGLPGVTLLDRHLHHLAMEVQTYGWYVGVIVADLDSFSNLNRLLGYAECDDLLRDLTCRFRDIFPREAFIARTGPDSFAACIPRAGKAVVEALCQRVADAFSFEYGYGEGGSVRISASIGAAYSHVNRRVLSLHTEAEALAGRAAGTGRASLLVRCLDSRAGSEEP